MHYKKSVPDHEHDFQIGPEAGQNVGHSRFGEKPARREWCKVNLER